MTNLILKALEEGELLTERGNTLLANSEGDMVAYFYDESSGSLLIVEYIRNKYPALSVLAKIEPDC